MKDGAAEYLTLIQRKIADIENELPKIVRAADLTAEKIVRGGKLYAASDEDGFQTELLSRSGGLMGMSRLDLAAPASEDDVVLLGDLQQRPKSHSYSLRERRKKYSPLVIAFASSESDIRTDCDILIDNGLPAGTAPVIRSGEESICPAGGVINIASAWAFTAEYVASCSRRGRMPVCWQSACVPNGMKWNERYMGRVFHEPEEVSIEGIPPGELAKRYLDYLQHALRGLEANEMPKFERAGRLASKAIRRGNTVWCDCTGHHMPAQKGMAGDPGIVRMVFPERKETSGPFVSGDVFFYNGYFLFPEDIFEKVREAEVASVWIMGGRERMPELKADRHEQMDEIQIDAHWHYGDACIKVPGYEIPIIPPSGVVMTTTLWMLIAETAKALSS
jgi:uncharacterized phosphosugar-binding protein